MSAITPTPPAPRFTAPARPPRIAWLAAPGLLAVYAALAGLAAAAAPGTASAAPAAELAATYAAAAPAPASPARGQQFFNVRHGGEWACATCHGAVPVQPGKHASTGRSIAPLAPAANPERLTDPAKVEKWLRRNCRDVTSRECTAQEKADVLAWLTTLKP